MTRKKYYYYVKKGGHPNAHKTHCIRGHEFNESNTSIVRFPGRRPFRKCKSCARIWGNINHHKYKEVRVKYRSKPEVMRRVALLARVRRSAQLEKDREYHRRWAKANIHKRKRCREHDLCRSALSNAVKAGKIKRPLFCHRCGADGKIQAHHKDYSKPFEVEWLCAKCHGKEHRKYK